jgi:5-(carboxyamino)imidazole ribonucleotide mutase
MPDDERVREEHRSRPRVGVIMGSDSDWTVMADAAEALAEFDVPFEVGVVSAHRTPGRMLDYARGAAGRGIEVIIAGAGGAAHLPGMVASATPLPVIGVPVPLARLDGLDSLLSIVQMPAGVPVATVSIGGARNAGLLAVRILGAADGGLRERIAAFQADLEAMVLAKDEALRDRLLGDASDE